MNVGDATFCPGAKTTGWVSGETPTPNLVAKSCPKAGRGAHGWAASLTETMVKRDEFSLVGDCCWSILSTGNLILNVSKIVN